MIHNSRLKEIASWPASYYETGIVPTKMSIDSMDAFLGKLSEASIPEPSVYPTHSDGLVAEWSIQDWELSVELGADGVQLYFQGLNMRTNDTLENTANSKNDTELNELLIFMRHFFDIPEQLEACQKTKPILVGWANPKDLEKMQGDTCCAMIWNDQLEPGMVPLYTLPSQK